MNRIKKQTIPITSPVTIPVIGISLFELLVTMETVDEGVD
jgi:hypothetical protein